MGDCARCSTLIDAIENDKCSQECVVRCIEKGADIESRDDQGRTALHAALYNKKPETALWLIQHGANPREQDNYSRTPLHEASSKGYVEIVEALLEKGSSVDEIDSYKNTPLHHAAFEGQTKVIEVLLDRGAQVDAKAWDDWTPLHRAARAGVRDAVELLLSRGASTKAKLHAPFTRDNGRTAAEVAKGRGHTPLVELINSYGHREPERATDSPTKFEPIDPTESENKSEQEPKRGVVSPLGIAPTGSSGLIPTPQPVQHFHDPDQQLVERVYVLEDQQRGYGSKMEDALDYLEQILEIEERNKEIYSEEADELRALVERLQERVNDVEAKHRNDDLQQQVTELGTSVRKLKSLQQYAEDLEQKIEQQENNIATVKLRLKAMEFMMSLFVIVVLVLWVANFTWGQLL